jgi:hypothetical protein
MRLWKRYLTSNTTFVLAVAKQLLGRKRAATDAPA